MGAAVTAQRQRRFHRGTRRRRLPQELDLHSLRHSYVTHVTEFDYPERFIQDQVGHCYASTTSIYSHVSDEYRNRLVCAPLAKRGLAFKEVQQ